MGIFTVADACNIPGGVHSLINLVKMYTYITNCIIQLSNTINTPMQDRPLTALVSNYFL